MKISTNTIHILKSFAKISSAAFRFYRGKHSFHSQVGNRLQVVASIEDEFPIKNECYVYDFDSLVWALSAAQDPDIEFTERTIKVRSQDGITMELVLGDEHLWKSGPFYLRDRVQEGVKPDQVCSDLSTVCELELTEPILKRLVEALKSLFGEKAVVTIYTENTDVMLRVTDKATWTVKIGESDLPFEARIDPKVFVVLLPASYRMRLVTKEVPGSQEPQVLLCLSGTWRSNDVTYLAACNERSWVAQNHGNDERAA